MAITGQAEAGLLDELRARVARLERRGGGARAAVLGFGVREIDRAVPGGGLARGAPHEVARRGRDVEYGTAAALLIAGLLARVRGPVLWLSHCRLE